MKILATGDWHLGNTFHGIDRLDEHKHFLNWLLDRIEEHRPAALLVAGDVFDNANPSAASQQAYYNFLINAVLKCPDMKIIVTAGNHDSAGRLEAPRDILSHLQVETRGNISRRYRYDEDGTRITEIDFDDLIIPLGEDVAVLAVPYLRSDVISGDSYSAGVMGFLKDLTKRARELHPGKTLVMMAHMYAKGADIDPKDASEKIIIGGQEEVTMEGWPDHPDYLTCGHIHKRQHIWGTDWARYTGSVLPMSFAEKDYRHGVDLITINEDGKCGVTLLEYTPQHPLMLIPEDEGAYTLAKLKKLIKQSLPKPTGAMPDDKSVYVTLKVNMDNIDNDGIKELEAMTAERNAVVCKIQKIMPAIDLPTISQSEKIESIDDILNRDPLETLKDTFRIKHGSDMTDRQLSLLTEMFSGKSEFGRRPS